MSTDDATDATPDAPRAVSQRSITRAATLTSLGNLSSRAVGLLRETVKSFYFGNGRAASAYELASNLPTAIYDALIGGMLNSALVPTFSEMAQDERRKREYGELLGALIGLAGVGLAVVIALLWLLAWPLAQFRGGPSQIPGELATLFRITFPAILFMSLSGIVTAALQARQRFGYTAFTATVFNLTMIVCMVLFEAWLGVVALAIGMLAGSVMQLLIQLPGLHGIPIRLSLNWRHPGVMQIIRLFLPVVGGLLLAFLATEASYIASTQIGSEGPATMRYAAQIIQFPIGMIISAVSVAILPAMSASTGTAFRETLARGLRLTLVLTAPAAVGLYVLATPVVALLFQRGAFDAQSTADVALALRAAVPNLLFMAVDIPMLYAFYAMRNTRTPTLVGLASTLFYIVILVLQVFASRQGWLPFTLDRLILSNSLKTGVDAALMTLLLWPRLGGLRGYGVFGTALKALIAAVLMGVAVWFVSDTLRGLLGLETLIPKAIVAAGGALAGVLVFGVLGAVLKIDEIDQIRARLMRRFRRPAA
jgi:putative peptidoglycan lipid II flippase